MSDDDTSKPKKQPGSAKHGDQARAQREARLSEALRANLQRRKAQTRGRKAQSRDPSPGDSD